MAGTELIRCEGVGYRYPGGVQAIRGISCTVQSGEVVGVVGQNGSGKTSFVKHFNGLLKPTEGSVWVDGVNTRKIPTRELAATVGYVFQNPNHQLFAKSVEDELGFGPRNLGLPADEIENRVERALEFFDLIKVRAQHPYRLSFPIRKVVGIASVYTMRPKVMVLDEPTTGQDHAGIRIVRDLIRQLRDEELTVVVVSHDMPLIAEETERVLVLADAELIADGPPGKVFAQDDVLKRTNLKRPQISELCHRLDVRGQGGGLVLSVPEAASLLAPRLIEHRHEGQA